MSRPAQTMLFLPLAIVLSGCGWTAQQKEPETFHENESGFVDDEDGKGTHWESNEVKGVRGGWELKHEK
jgi:hypothetical protein